MTSSHQHHEITIMILFFKRPVILVLFTIVNSCSTYYRKHKGDWSKDERSMTIGPSNLMWIGINVFTFSLLGDAMDCKSCFPACACRRQDGRVLRTTTIHQNWRPQLNAFKDKSIWDLFT
ncbi:hypothetical protein TCAL_15778, partial [Tigriopus californicus]